MNNYRNVVNSVDNSNNQEIRRKIRRICGITMRQEDRAYEA